MNINVSKLVPLVVKILPYAKAVAATIGALVTTLVCLSDGQLIDSEFAVIGTAWATVFAVWRVTNRKA